MASHIEVQAAKEPHVTKGDIREVLRGLGASALSAESPVSGRAREVAVVTDDDRVTLKVNGHDGEWSQESQQTILSALSAVDGVGTPEVVDGGYEESEPDDGDADGDADSEPDGDEDDEEIDADLTDLPHVGDDTAESMVEEGFGSVAVVAAAESAEELEVVTGLGSERAEDVYEEAVDLRQRLPIDTGDS